MVRRVFGLFVGAFQLFALVNACVRSIGGKWLLGSLGGLLRTFLLIAITMASARIRVAHAEPTAGYTVALYAGPILSVVLLLLALHRQRALPAGSEARASADRIVTSWMVVAAIDAVFVVIGLGSRLVYAHAQ
jgi:hypothetical protein